ncbi:hypothetical protein DP43_207 [Burkholderia pseudomallei]|nr:hypothetical protein DP43_207 [Burkholderia pseudomallei]
MKPPRCLSITDGYRYWLPQIVPNLWAFVQQLFVRMFRESMKCGDLIGTVRGWDKNARGKQALRQNPRKLMI